MLGLVRFFYVFENNLKKQLFHILKYYYSLKYYYNKNVYYNAF